MRKLQVLLIIILSCVTSESARGAALGIGIGTIGKAPSMMGHIRYRSLLDRIVNIPHTTSILAFGITSQTGFLDDHGLESAFVGGGYRFDFDEEESESPTKLYATAMLMGFPRNGGGISVGGVGHLGIQRSVTFPSGFPGGYFAEAGVVACEEFVTVSWQVGIFAGR